MRCTIRELCAKLSTQIYKAQYGDAIFVPFQGTQIWSP